MKIPPGNGDRGSDARSVQSGVSWRSQEFAAAARDKRGADQLGSRIRDDRGAEKQSGSGNNQQVGAALALVQEFMQALAVIGRTRFIVGDGSRAKSPSWECPVCRR
jgi:hypothetical protein